MNLQQRCLQPRVLHRAPGSRHACRPVAVGQRAPAVLPTWGPNNSLGPLQNNCALHMRAVGRLQAMSGVLSGQQPDNTILPQVSYEEDACYLQFPGVDIKCTLQDYLANKRPDGLTDSEMTELMRAVHSVLTMGWRGILCMPPSLEDFMVIRQPGGKQRKKIVFVAFHKCQVVGSLTKTAYWVPGEVTGTPYSDPLGVYHMRPVNNCTTVSDVVAALGQVLHLAATGHSVFGILPEDRRDAHIRVQSGAEDVAAIGCDEVLVDFILQAVSSEPLDVDKALRHMALNQDHPSLVAELMMAVGSLAQDSLPVSAGPDTQQDRRQVLSAASTAYRDHVCWVERDMEAQLGSILRDLLDLYDPDDVESDFSCGRTRYNLMNGLDTFLSFRNTSSHPNKFVSDCLQDYWRELRAESPQASNAEFLQRMVLPRLLRGYERLQHAAGHPKVPRARAVAPLGLALQNVLVKHEPALRHFGVRLQPFIREQPSTPYIATHERRSALLRESVILYNLASNRLPQLNLLQAIPEEGDDADSLAARVLPVAAAGLYPLRPEVMSSGSQSSGNSSSENTASSIVSTGMLLSAGFQPVAKPMLHCQGCSPDLPPVSSLASRQEQQAMLPSVAVLTRQCVLTQLELLQQLPCAYATQQLYSCLIAAGLQGLGGCAVMRLIEGLCQATLLAGHHPAHSRAERTAGLRFACEMLLHLHADLRLPAELDACHRGNVLAHVVLYVANTQSWEAAGALPVPQVGPGCAASLRQCCQQISSGSVAEGLQGLAAVPWRMLPCWLLRGQVVQLQEQVAQQLQEKGAQQLQEKGVIATLDAEQLAGQLCMRLDTAQQGELVGCFQPAELPADPFGFQAQRDLDKALTCLMLAQGFVAGGDGQHFKYKVKQATSKAVTARHKRSKSAEGGSLQSSSLPQAAPAGSLPPVPPPSPPSKPPLASAVRSASAWSAPALELNSSTVSAAVMARVPKSTGR